MMIMSCFYKSIMSAEDSLSPKKETRSVEGEVEGFMLGSFTRRVYVRVTWGEVGAQRILWEVDNPCNPSCCSC